MSLRLNLSDLEQIAIDHGFADYRSMLYELYVVQQQGLYEISRRCHVHYRRTRKHLRRFGIPVRRRGGPNNLRVALTPELLLEITRDGVPAVSERLGVTDTALRSRLKVLVQTPVRRN